MISRHSKIVCTIGPATRSPRMIRKLMQAGMDVARLNFSHGTHEEHAQSIAMLREAAMEMKKPIAILADLQGPKIRTGALAGGGTVLLARRAAFRHHHGEGPGRFDAGKYHLSSHAAGSEARRSHPVERRLD